MPVIDLFLHTRAHGQQFTIPRAELVHDPIKRQPELLGDQASTGKHLMVNEIAKLRGNSKVPDLYAVSQNLLQYAEVVRAGSRIADTCVICDA